MIINMNLLILKILYIIQINYTIKKKIKNINKNQKLIYLIQLFLFFRSDRNKFLAFQF